MCVSLCLTSWARTQGEAVVDQDASPPKKQKTDDETPTDETAAATN